uniref:Endonuclease/exonuclease/phosphatase domain-containing protein n=1 Tax=Alexandrium andersonii TaxID=327968 RepID=A0A7S2DM23_9DINO|mmetsp:Transcript_56242/g.126771  ORF Transcript_56242/g.126771 Transcript_56242/m.126771 type:complete len:163 (+) Transcript_56242:1-489(+)
MSGSMATFVGGHACCIAYNKDKFKLLSKGKKEVAEDERAQYYGKRGMMWVRLEYKEGGKTILFANHHGPLRVNSGGQCGGKATAWNIVNTLKEEAKGDDAIVIVGDFNADDKSVTQRELMRFMNRLGSNWVDTVMSNCKSGTWKTLPKGGSDHNAVKVELSI